MQLNAAAAATRGLSPARALVPPRLGLIAKSENGWSAAHPRPSVAQGLLGVEAKGWDKARANGRATWSGQLARRAEPRASADWAYQLEAALDELQPSMVRANIRELLGQYGFSHARPLTPGDRKLGLVESGANAGTHHADGSILVSHDALNHAIVELRRWRTGDVKRLNRDVTGVGVLIHEEIHGLGARRVAEAARSGVATWVEEVVTESVTQQVLHRAFGFTPRQYAYGPATHGMVDTIVRETGVSHAQAWRDLDAASGAFKRMRPKETGSAEAFVLSFVGHFNTPHQARLAAALHRAGEQWHGFEKKREPVVLSVKN